MRNTQGIEPKIIAEDLARARSEKWWGHLVPPESPVNLAGRWVGTWKGLGLFDSLRESAVEARLVQQGGIGVAHLYFDNTIAAGVPWVIRRQGAGGVRLVYRMDGTDALMRLPGAPSELTAAFTLVNDRLIGTLPSADSPVVITLTRAK